MVKLWAAERADPLVTKECLGGGERAAPNTGLKDKRRKNSARKGDRTNKLNAFNFFFSLPQNTVRRKLMISENPTLETSEYAKTAMLCLERDAQINGAVSKKGMISTSGVVSLC